MLRPCETSTRAPGRTESLSGEVGDKEVRLADGTVVGVGDVVVTRLNRRALVTGSGWVKNGDDWIVQAIDEGGAMRVRRVNGGAARSAAR